MKAQTRIFSVATTIACFALASPGFAQTYIGGSSQPSVQVDLGALDALPGPAQATTAIPAHHRGKKTNSKAAAADIGDYQTTIIGGGSDELAPIKILRTGTHIKPAPSNTKPAMSADQLNAMQLSKKTVLANSTPATPAQASVSAMPLDNAPSLAQPFDRPPVPPALPEDHVAGLPPTRDDYDERRKQRPALPTEPILPPAGPAPEEVNGAQKTTFVLPKLPPNTPITADALNRAELNQILVQNGQEPLPPLPSAAPEAKPARKHHAAASAHPHKRRATGKIASASISQPTRAPVVTAQTAPPLGDAPAVTTTRPSKVKAKAPSKKISAARSSLPAAQAVLTADSLNRQELAKLSSTNHQSNSVQPPVSEAQPTPTVEQMKVAPPAPAVEQTKIEQVPAVAPAPIQRTVSTPPSPPVSPAPAPVQRAANIAPPPVVPAPPPPPVQAAPPVVLPPPTKAPASTPEDLIDEGPQPYQPRTRIITDSNSPQAPSSPSSNFSVGYYDIPSDIQMNGNQQAAPVTKAPLTAVQRPVVAPAPVPAPTPQAAPQILSVAPSKPPTAPIIQSPAATPLDQTPIVATPLPQPAPPPKNVPASVSPPPEKPAQAVVETASPATPGTEALPLDQPISLMPAAPAATPAPVQKPAATVAKQPLSKAQDTTQNLNQTELSKSVTAMPLDQPPAPVTAPAQAGVKTATLPPPPESKPAPASPSAMKLSSSEDLAVTFTPGSTSLSQETTGRLDMLVSHMKQNPDLHVELRSLASADKESTSKARRTSLARALAIKSYLQSQGIAEDHIDVRALGAPPGQPPSDRVDFFLMR